MAKAEKGREKTNVMRTLEQAGIAYTPHWYDPEETKGTDIAVTLGESVECVFKTLVTEGPGREHFVFVIPVAETLDLKKAARAVGVKNIAMIPQKELLPLTGYVHGGCSPVGMKKPFPTFIDETALLCERFYCSAGRVGAQVEVSAEALAEYIGAEFADLTV
ncbi:MAG: Cys-tRNA(Pro) deacylase [Oscillospiraceae bacterium]|nr:Cys-tRNA(Pro) deacylase [bacterium]MDY5101340.1 Cys-tRNA(Pro) deacylase [Oscillospiraceae bacterium]